MLQAVSVSGFGVSHAVFSAKCGVQVHGRRQGLVGSSRPSPKDVPPHWPRFGGISFGGLAMPEVIPIAGWRNSVKNWVVSVTAGSSRLVVVWCRPCRAIEPASRAAASLTPNGSLARSDALRGRQPAGQVDGGRLAWAPRRTAHWGGKPSRAHESDACCHCDCRCLVGQLVRQASPLEVKESPRGRATSGQVGTGGLDKSMPLPKTLAQPERMTPSSLSSLPAPTQNESRRPLVSCGRVLWPRRSSCKAPAGYYGFRAKALDRRASNARRAVSVA